jgi:PadR family transcriptional regulator
MPTPKTDLLQGTLDLLILNTLLLEPRHGLGIARRLEQVTRGAFAVRPGSLFPALHRLEDRGFVAGYWGESENRRRARFYKVTAAGRRRLKVETATWERVAAAIRLALDAGEESAS